MRKKILSLVIIFFALGILISIEESSAQNQPAAKTTAQEEAIKKIMDKKGALIEETTGMPLKVEGPALAPDFKLQDIHQDMVSLSDYKGQPVLLFFWATWNPTAETTLRSLNSMYQGLLQDGLDVLAINVGELPDKVINFTQNFDLVYRVLLDKDSAVFFAYGLQGMPVYILVDKQGYVVFQDDYFPLKEYKDLISN